MNKVILMGRLTRDPEIRYSAGAETKAIANFTLAVDRRYKKDGDQTADFIGCTAFGKLAEFVEKYIRKGQKILIEGHWQTGSYEKNGIKYYTNNCIIEQINFAENKKESSPVQDPQTDADGFSKIPDDMQEELPFS